MEKSKEIVHLAELPSCTNRKSSAKYMDMYGQFHHHNLRISILVLLPVYCILIEKQSKSE